MAKHEVTGPHAVTRIAERDIENQREIVRLARAAADKAIDRLHFELTRLRKMEAGSDGEAQV